MGMYLDKDAFKGEHDIVDIQVALLMVAIWFLSVCIYTA